MESMALRVSGLGAFLSGFVFAGAESSGAAVAGGVD